MILTHSRATPVGLLALTLIGTATLSRAAEDETRRTESLVFNCYTCHGTDGKSPGQVPTLAGQPAEYIKQLLLKYKQDQITLTIMNRIAKGYSDDELARIADYIGRLE